MSGSGPYGPGRRSEPHEVSGGRREAPFGPDISWPNGFRQLDSDARRLLEDGYGTSGHGRGQYERVDPGYGGRGPGYRQPDPPSPVDDYGDPGYSDPAYDGPRSGSGSGSGGRGWKGDNRAPRSPAGPPLSDGSGYGGMPGYHVPDYREPARPDVGYQQGYAESQIYPVTGAQEALPATGPQPIADSWAGRDTGPAWPGRQADSGPRQDHPRLEDPRGSGARPDGPPATDPRLEGMRYDELRYDEPSGYDEPLDDDSWVEELRRSAPAYPQPPAGPTGTSAAATRAVPATASCRVGDPGTLSPGWTSRAATRRRSATGRAAMTGVARARRGPWLPGVPG